MQAPGQSVDAVDNLAVPHTTGVHCRLVVEHGQDGRKPWSLLVSSRQSNALHGSAVFLFTYDAEIYSGTDVAG